jgi:hypothetical protein
MIDKEQRQRERAYRIWEKDGRPDGAHEDHWRRAGQESELSEQEADDVTKVNQEADNRFAGPSGGSDAGVEKRPPSTAVPD